MSFDERKTMYNDLIDCKMSDLENLAAELGIKDWFTMIKRQLVEAIVAYHSMEEFEESLLRENQTLQEIEENEKKVKHRLYLIAAQPGCLVAYIVPKTGRMYTAKILCNDNRSYLRVESLGGNVYTIHYDNVVWVKTGLRWPRGVWDVLRRAKEASYAE